MLSQLELRSLFNVILKEPLIAKAVVDLQLLLLNSLLASSMLIWTAAPTGVLPRKSVSPL